MEPLRPLRAVLVAGHGHVPATAAVLGVGDALREVVAGVLEEEGVGAAGQAREGHPTAIVLALDAGGIHHGAIPGLDAQFLHKDGIVVGQHVAEAVEHAVASGAPAFVAGELG